MKRTHLGTAIGAAAASVALGMTLAGPAGAVAPDNAPFCAAGAFTLSNTTPGAIPDGTGGSVSRAIAVTGQTGTIRDLDVITNITHTYNGELQIELTHTPTSGPAKTVRFVTSKVPNRAGQNGFNGTRWDDSALLPVSAAIENNVSGPQLNLVPEGAMASFIGRDPNGTWTLNVRDTVAADTGTLNSWTLDVKTSTQPATSTTANFVGPGDPIPDAVSPTTPGVLTKTLQVSGAAKYLTDLDLNTNIFHQFGEDLEIELTSPSGTKAVISRRRGDQSTIALTTKWNDSAATDVVRATWTPGNSIDSLVPEGALGAFIGENPNGAWTLTIRDIAVADTGTLNGWSLDVASTDGCAPPPPGSNPPPATTPPRVALPPGPVCTKVNLATTILGAKRGERGENAIIRVRVANKTKTAGARGAKAVFKLPAGFTLVKGQKGISLKNGKVTATFGAIAGGKAKTVAIKLKTKAGAALGLKTSSVAVTALCGSKAKAATIKLTVAA